MGGIALNDSPTAMQAAQDDSDSRLGEGEEYASPAEHQFLDKVMSLVYQALNDPQKDKKLEYMLHQAKDLGVAIGNISWSMLLNIYMSAKNSGQQLPVSVFLGQGGAVQQTIEAFLHFAEACHIPYDPDHVRETAMGVVMMNLKKNMALLQAPPQGQQQQQQGAPQQQQMMPANPMSHAVGQGLQQQGLLSGA